MMVKMRHKHIIIIIIIIIFENYEVVFTKFVICQLTIYRRSADRFI